MTEFGVPGFEIDSWIGIFAPAKTPPAVIARLQQEIAAAGAELKPRLATAGGELMEIAPDKLNAFIKADYDKWIKIIQGRRHHARLSEIGSRSPSFHSLMHCCMRAFPPRRGRVARAEREPGRVSVFGRNPTRPRSAVASARPPSPQGGGIKAIAVASVLIIDSV